jgi:hypothetical protein
MKVTEMQKYVKMFMENLKELEISEKVIKEKVYPKKEGKGLKKEDWVARLKCVNLLYFSPEMLKELA